MSVKMSIKIRIYNTDKKTHKQNVKQEFLIIYFFVFLPKMQPRDPFQVNVATNVFFMISGGCFISKIISLFGDLKNICKIRLHVYTSLRAGVAVLGKKMSVVVVVAVASSFL